MALSRSWRTVVGLVLLTLLALIPSTRLAAQTDTPQPKSVTIPGTIQSKLGCSGDWQQDCAKTHLTYDSVAGIWTGEWELPAGKYEYKAAINDSWDENYGLKAGAGGANIPLEVPAPQKVKFYYDHKTHWVTDNVNSVIATVAGSFQSKVGCAKDWMPECLRGWLQDPAGSGIYTWSTKGIPQGSYEAKVAIKESWDENYGADGAKGGANIPFTVEANGDEIGFRYDSKTHKLTIGTPQRGNLSRARAYWVTHDTIAWPIDNAAGNTYTLHYDPAGALKLDTTGVTGGESRPLTADVAGLPQAVLAKFPQFAGYTALKLDAPTQAKIATILKGQITVSAQGANGKLIDATSLQIPGVLDDLYTYDGALGVVYAGDTPTLKVWAPTARSVNLVLFDDATTAVSTTVAMTADPAKGVWSAAGQPAWTGKFYLYDVEVFVPSTGKVEHNLVTDPYSVSLATDSTRSQIVNLADASLKPDGWDGMQKPPLAAPEDVVVYELHLRDFSISDQTVPEAHRGTYLAFTDSGSDGMKHLKALAEAGLTHIHLLPLFDIATIEEDKSKRTEPDPARLAGKPANSVQPQQLLSTFRDQDGFNWGYDPYHYGVPEGSYATDSNGAARIREFRQMVQGLNGAGLRLVMDVVYNHTSASGQDPKSVLDRVVPGYYQRLNGDGAVETSTCCQNTATEHAMMEKLMVDTLVQWARAYKVDGFRFDLMGHHMVTSMTKARDALHALTVARDGVDGSKIYLYGEGWNFGEVADNKLGVNATQINMAGTGIGTFNDRIRDAARGGGPFSGPQEQGFIDGLLDAPNGTNQGTVATQTTRLLQYSDWIRVGLAGNLKDYPLVDSSGKAVTGKEVNYNGAPTGYTADPQEDINYVEAHDNETLYDAIAYKAPVSTTMADRVRMQDLGMDLVALGQGVPFFHAGVDMLRSKSLDSNSYNSGDWFNRLDFTYESNNWGVGLPPQSSNDANWPLMRPLLADPALKPAKADILHAVAHFREMLQIRKSSPLFRLQTAQEVNTRLHFLNTGPQQIPGVIVMTLTDGGGADLDPAYDGMVVVFNATSKMQTVTDPALAGVLLTLHPVQAASDDPLVRTAKANTAAGSLTVPERTTAVFVVKQGAGGKALAANGATSTGGTPVSTSTGGTTTSGGAPAGGTSAGGGPLPPSGAPDASPATWLALALLLLVLGFGLRRGMQGKR